MTNKYITITEKEFYDILDILMKVYRDQKIKDKDYVKDVINMFTSKYSAWSLMNVTKYYYSFLKTNDLYNPTYIIILTWII